MNNNDDLGGVPSKGVPGKMRGARPSSRQKLAASVPFVLAAPYPVQFATVPAKLSVWGNDRFGCCVSSEEAFAKACFSPEIFIEESVVTQWASRRGFLNGADLTEVMDAMQRDGYQVGPNTFNDGPYRSVDFSNEAILQAAIAEGPVKIGIDADALPGGAGNHNGWFALGGGNYRNEDHCVALCGYGPAAWLYQQLNVPLPSGLAATTPGYLLFTWGTIGFVTHAWIMGTVGEAWLRSPTTVIEGPSPFPTPTPTPTPTPGPVPSCPATLLVTSPLSPGSYPVCVCPTASPSLPPLPWQMLLKLLIAWLLSLEPTPPTPPGSSRQSA